MFCKTFEDTKLVVFLASEIGTVASACCLIFFTAVSRQRFMPATKISFYW